MKRLQISDTKLGGVIVATADLPFGTASGYAQFDFLRDPSTQISNKAGLRLAIEEAGSVSVYVLKDNVWSRVEHATVGGVNSMQVRRMDVFVWEVSVTSGTDTALNKKWHIDYQGDFLTEPLDASQLLAERNDSVRINIYANGNADIANLEVRAEKNVW